MRFVDEYRDPKLARRLVDEVRREAEKIFRTVRFMEVCGGHTMAIHRFGIGALLPENIELLSGPGCPVCVTPTTYIDRAVEMALEDGALLTTFGDLYRVPGGECSLEDAVARGADVRVVYSPRDALRIARENPSREVVFLGVGFETTAPAVAATILGAAAEDARNFRVMSGHKTMPRAMRALVEGGDAALDGFILPGHVATVSGAAPYRFLPDEYGLACCVSGFEPTDLLRAILSLTKQVAEGGPNLDNQYHRAVKLEGNPLARKAVEQVFLPADSQWRGLGMVPGSGLDVRPEFSAHAAPAPDPAVPSAESGACRCPEVLRGLAHPPECPLFAKACTPDSPVGACMVSSEGACAAAYKYGIGEERQ